jgi:hypothetical protein
MMAKIARTQDLVQQNVFAAPEAETKFRCPHQMSLDLISIDAKITYTKSDRTAASRRELCAHQVRTQEINNAATESLGQERPRQQCRGP